MSPYLTAGTHIQASNQDLAQSLLSPPLSLLLPARRRQLAPKLCCHLDTQGLGSGRDLCAPGARTGRRRSC